MYYIFIFLLYALLCYSATQMIVYMRGPFAIFEKFRIFMADLNDEFGELLGCEYCTSTWVSYLISIINLIIIPSIAFTPFNLLLGGHGLWWLIIILDGIFGSGAAWMMFRLEDALVAIKEKNQTYEDDKK